MLKKGGKMKVSIVLEMEEIDLITEVLAKHMKEKIEWDRFIDCARILLYLDSEFEKLAVNRGEI